MPLLMRLLSTATKTPSSLQATIINIQIRNIRYLIFACKIPANTLHKRVLYKPWHRTAPLLYPGHVLPQPEGASETSNAALMLGSDDPAGLDGVAVMEIASYMLEWLILRLGSVRWAR
jgi:hypothetical protein